MPIITKITVQQKKRDRYNIFTDDGNGEKYAFSVDEDVLIKHQLKKGMELDEFSLTEIDYQDSIRKAYNMAIQYLSRRMRSEAEVRNNLREKEIDDVIIQEVIHKLYEYSFLNDEEFAIAYVRTQMNTTDKGSGLIRKELKEKGISENLIDQAMKEYPDEEEFNKALAMCEKYVQKNTRDSSRGMKQKLEQMLKRKGFQFGTIQAAIAETEMEKAEDDEMSALRSHAEKAHRKFSVLTDFEYEQKMKLTLFRKGFSMELIDQILHEFKDI
ncbi:recombination regulator RecX [Bacillus sp. FJAT-29790]|uniref:recombination regulator RecX n=1 Tax=Bacillus sp. FJAT-29790 TaxID=1895002 RepID=UPI001C222B41|nr:recombination regulator RecX [Bacillus sp. FJAT-29790]MBU8880592.1 recombination regulator RecX [Bacillus sp. FJAT-29790]